MFDDVTSVALHSALRGLALRQRTIADNIANIETPGFKAGRAQFEEALKSALVDGRSPDVEASIATSLQPARLNGNNVNLDHETLSDLDTGLRYQLALRAVDAKFNLLRASMRNA